MKKTNNEKKYLCQICPRNCKIDRTENTGFCNEKQYIRVAKTIKHFKWEEPCLTDEKGCLAIFFSGCNLKCDYCQNHKISGGGKGTLFSIKEFCDFILENQKDHSYIDLITPTHFSKQLHEVFSKIKTTIPVIWNTNSYETVENIKYVSSFVDIFLADLKYGDDLLGREFSCCDDYFSRTVLAIKEMCKQKQDIVKNQQMFQGVIIRHLVLPYHTQNSFKVLQTIKEEFADRKISIMSQFTPNGKSKLDRKLKPIEYKVVLAHLNKLNLNNGYIQDFDSASTEYVPDFNKTK